MIGWRTGNHRFDIGGQILERRDKKRSPGRQPSGENEIGQNEVKPRSRSDDQELSPQSLVRKRSATILLCGGFGLIFTEQLDIATERNGREEIFCFAHLAAE